MEAKMSPEILLFVVVVIVALIIVAGFALMTRRATSGPKPALESQQWVAQAKVETGERKSALVSELVNLLSARPQWRQGFLQHVPVNASAAGLITRMSSGQMPVE
jgi:uncharacterized SAM-binding protein YcdF (DUF218 family)